MHICVEVFWLLQCHHRINFFKLKFEKCGERSYCFEECITFFQGWEAYISIYAYFFKF